MSDDVELQVEYARSVNDRWITDRLEQLDDWLRKLERTRQSVLAERQQLGRYFEKEQNKAVPQPPIQRAVAQGQRYPTAAPTPAHTGTTGDNR